ncbi:MAG: nucleoside-diphosphate sugar epimerase/dehydratase [Burkholderiales bacterium]
MPNPRTLLAFAHDVMAAVAAWLIAFWLRFNLDVPPLYHKLMLESLLWVVLLQATIFWLFGLYRGVWRYASVPDLKRIVLAVLVAALALPAFFLMLQMAVPRSVLLFDPILLVMLMGGSRFTYRVWKEQGFVTFAGDAREPVVIIGTEEAAVTLLKELARSPQWRAAAVFGDDETMVGRQVQGVRILGKIDDLRGFVERLGVRHAIIAMPAASHGARRRAVTICSDAGLKIMTVPSYDDLVSGKVTVSQIRHVELDDLLGRDPVVLDAVGLKDWIHDRVIMVTGAGGSIGSELCRQLARFNPRTIVLFELGEFALYNMEQEFRRNHPSIPLICAIGDVKQQARVDEVMGAHRPSVVFHAAAYKHVPLMESANAWQAVLNNVAGTHVVAEAALRNGVEKFVFISTDKAINPTSVMGASKRLAEMVCQALQEPQRTRFVMVRFGNVLGSTGSVIPKFKEQIAAGGPVTVTHPEITRYFMSIPEAAQLVLQAGLMGNGGEIFVLEMGEPVLIADLARDLIRLSGFSMDEIKVVYTGLRAGEKLYEELLAADEDSLPTPHPKLRIAKARSENAAWLAQLLEWLRQSAPRGDDPVRKDLARWLPEYRSE